MADINPRFLNQIISALSDGKASTEEVQMATLINIACQLQRIQSDLSAIKKA